MPEGELAPVNTFYGHADILRRYAQLDDDPIPAVIPHSPAPASSFVWDGERLPAVPAVLCYPDHRIVAYERATRKRVLAAASPYVYVQRLAGHPAEGGREGTIFFPSHSTHHITVELDPERLADALLDVDEPFAPVTVCMYWRDVQLERHHAFIERGFNVVSAGHIFDPEFLFRLHALCGRHRYATGNSLGAHMFFAVASGCRYVVFDAIGSPPPSPVESPGPSAENAGVRVPEHELDLSAVRKIRPTFLTGSPDPESQRRLSEYFLSAQHAVPPEQLQGLLRRLRSLDKTQVVVSRRDGKRHVAVPPFWRRLAHRLMRELRARVALRTRIRRLIGRFR